MLKRWIWSAAIVWMALSSAHAAVLQVTGGELTGATSVNVGGTLYDVRFVEGSCISVFSGCDSTAYFTFTTPAAALLASQALLDQVFVDGIAGQFDTQPVATAGCDFISVCAVHTPYGPDAEFAAVGLALNWSTQQPDAIQVTVISSSLDTAGFELQQLNSVYAVWSVQPQSVDEPSAVACLAIGFMALAWARRRRKLL